MTIDSVPILCEEHEQQQVIHGDCLEEMRKFEDNYFSSVVTDPPYGLKFMGKEWDHGIPGKEFWAETLRICKPGSWMLAFGGTRTYHRLTCAIEDAGWEIRDCLMWIYGSGFPKGKACLKPAYEPIILARKASRKIADNFLNIDECRIGTFENTQPSGLHRENIFDISPKNADNFEPKINNVQGRWPANVLFDEEAAEMLDEQTGILTSGSIGLLNHTKSNDIYGHFHKANINQFFANSGGASRFFYCAKASTAERNEGLEGLPCKSRQQDGDPANWDLSSEKIRAGLTTKPQMNHHPTVKPLKLLDYLIKLITPKDGIVLDPFVGSGSTLIAAKHLGLNAIGIEKQKEYCDIAIARLK
jgi:site-specific DNA-methyltransferase (adenine-specific)